MTIDKQSLLASHYMFRDIEPVVLSRITDLGVTKRLDRQEVLFHKGDEGDALYGILSGQIRISASSFAGKEVIMNVLKPGEIFGEIALLDGLPRTADATAMGKCELFMIRRRDFVAFLEREPKLAIHLLRMVCERVRWTSGLVEDAAFLPLESRLAKRLLALAGLYGEEQAEGGTLINIQLSQSELGRMMGTTRESVNRHLQAWKKDGFIDLGRGSVTIHDEEALEDIVDRAEFEDDE